MNQPEITRIIGQMILNKEPDEKILRTLIELSIDPNTAQQLITASRKSQGGSARVVSSRKALVIETYEIESDGVKLEVSVIQTPDDFVLHYYLNFPEYGEGTKALLANLKRAIISEASFKTDKLLDPKFVVSLKERFRAQAEATLRKENTKLDETTKQVLVADLIHEMLGLGKIEFLLSDGNLEEIVVNSAKDPAWVYSKKYGWLKTNVQIATEDEIQNYASIIARRVGKQVTVLNPLLDAHLITGDRANATLFPISSAGNTITIRRFRRDPWTVTDFIKTGTVNAEIMALM
jgi:flagellar protein FlaI